MKEKLRFVGMDVHAETIAAAIAEPDGEVRSLGTIPNRMDSVRKLLKKLGPVEKLRVCYEAGPTGYVLYWQLAELGVQCEVIAPSLVPVKTGDRVKTDRRDAEKLARSYRSGDLTAVWVPDAGSEALRDLVRAREAAKQDQLRARHRLGKFLLRSGQRPPSGVKSWTHHLHDLGLADTLYTGGSRIDAAGLSARSRTHARASGAARAGHRRGGQAGFTCIAGSHQGPTSTARRRPHFSGNDCGRTGSGFAFSRGSGTDGLLRRRTQRELQWKANPPREHYQIRQCTLETNNGRGGMEL